MDPEKVAIEAVKITPPALAALKAAEKVAMLAAGRDRRVVRTAVAAIVAIEATKRRPRSSVALIVAIDALNACVPALARPRIADIVAMLAASARP